MPLFVLGGWVTSPMRARGGLCRAPESLPFPVLRTACFWVPLVVRWIVLFVEWLSWHHLCLTIFHALTNFTRHGRTSKANLQRKMTFQACVEAAAKGGQTKRRVGECRVLRSPRRSAFCAVTSLSEFRCACPCTEQKNIQLSPRRWCSHQTSLRCSSVCQTRLRGASVVSTS